MIGGMGSTEMLSFGHYTMTIGIMTSPQLLLPAYDLHKDFGKDGRAPTEGPPHRGALAMDSI